jgi:hypothetical protein
MTRRPGTLRTALAGGVLTAWLAGAVQPAARADDSRQESRLITVTDAFSVVGHAVHSTGRGGFDTIFEVRNDSQEPAIFDATIQLLDASTAVVGSGAGVVDEAEVLPGLNGFVHLRSTGAPVVDARVVITSSHPVPIPTYRDLSVSPAAVSHPDALDTEYTVTVRNVGIRPAASIAVQMVTRDGAGEVLDESVTPASDPGVLPPGASRSVTVHRQGAGDAPSAPMFAAAGTETLSRPVIGAYDPDTVGGRLSTTWHLGASRRCSARIVRFTTTDPPATVARGTSSRKGVLRLRFALTRGYLYTMLIDPSATCGPYRFNDLTLKGAIAVSVSVPRFARLGRHFSVSGWAAAARVGDQVQVQRKSGGPWVILGRGRVHSDGRFTVRVALVAPGHQSLRVYIPHTSVHFGSASPTRTVLVGPR